MKKWKISAVFVLMIVGIFGTGVFAQQDCVTCTYGCNNDDWTGAITSIEPINSGSGKAIAATIKLALLPGWNGKDDDGCCNAWDRKVVQFCVEFGIRNFYFGSAITGWGWDANDDRNISESERMSHNSQYWAEWHYVDDVLEVTIHGIPLVNGTLEGNIYLVTGHGEINYFIPSLLYQCHTRDDGYGAGEIYKEFW
jgi:hypothetical protein